MRLIDQFVRDGDWLFRWRSYAPLALVPVLAGAVLADTNPFVSRQAERAWEIVAVAVALTGLAVRVWAVGTAPRGTSERSTVGPRASELRTTGPYSLVRHPLYVANGLMALGLALFPGQWYLGAITAAATLLYYERIAAREEAFLAERFGQAFVDWAGRVPAMLPAWSAYAAAGARVAWPRVAQEIHGLTVIAAGVFVLDGIQESRRAGAWAVDPVWGWAFVVVASSFAAFVVTKKTARLLSRSSSGHRSSRP